MTRPQDAALAYLATPYSKYDGGIEIAFRDACRLAGKLLLDGVKVYSPIAHSHPIAIETGLDPRDHRIWLPFEERMMTLASVLIVGMLPGWAESYGVRHEIGFFQRAGKPMFGCNPDTLTMWRADFAAIKESA